MNFAFPLSAIDAATERSEVNSSAFYFGAAVGDWTSPQNVSLWRDEAKTLFDPCPSGWRVPKSGEGDLNPWNYFTAENSRWNSSALPGRFWNESAVYGGTAWYCAYGLRTLSTQGGINFTGVGYYWSTTAPGPTPSRLRFDQRNVVADNYTGARAEGDPVRCVRE